MKSRLQLALLLLVAGFGYGGYEYYDFNSNEVPEMAETSLLHDMIGTLQSGAADAGLPGVGELLRTWKAALQDLMRSGTRLSTCASPNTAPWFRKAC